MSFTELITFLSLRNNKRRLGCNVLVFKLVQVVILRNYGAYCGTP